MPFFFASPFIIILIAFALTRVVFGFFMKPRKLSDSRPYSFFSADSDEEKKAEQLFSKYEVKIFRLADRKKGRITISEIIVETGLGMKQAESIINKMIDSTHVRMEITENGSVIYEFPELIEKHSQNQFD